MKYYLFTVLMILCVVNCAKKQEIPIQYNEKIYMANDFIKNDTNLNGYYLSRPKALKYHNNRLYVLDQAKGNICIFEFTKNGEYINKIGGYLGQGPGDIINPVYFDIDESGNMYIADETNDRISIFTKEGKFIKFIRINIDNNMKFIVKNNEIIMNNPFSGYYLQIYSLADDMLKSIGEAAKLNDDPYINFIFAEGSPCVDEHGNYSIYLCHLPKVIVYNKNGEFIYENEIKVPCFNKILNHDKYVPPEKQKGTVYRTDFMKTVKYHNGFMYVLTIDRLETEKGPAKIPPDLNVFMFDKSYDIVCKYNLLFRDSDKNKSMLLLWANIDFSIGENDKYIYIPRFDKGEVLRFIQKVK